MRLGKYCTLTREVIYYVAALNQVESLYKIANKILDKKQNHITIATYSRNIAF